MRRARGADRRARTMARALRAPLRARRESIGDLISDIGNDLTNAVNSVCNWVKSAGGALSDILSILGFVGTGVQLQFFEQVLSGSFDGPKLWHALGQDWATFQRDGDAAQALTDGDYCKAWNISTNNGQDFSQLVTDFGELAPQPQADQSFDASSLLSEALAGTVDQRDAAQQLFDHGYYDEGNEVLQAWTDSLVSTPLGGAIATATAEQTADPVQMVNLANTLTIASADSNVQAQWATAGWGNPGDELGGLATTLYAQAQAIAQANATPVYYDINPAGTWSNDAANAQAIADEAAGAPNVAPAAPVPAAAPAPMSTPAKVAIAGGVGFALVGAAKMILGGGIR